MVRQVRIRATGVERSPRSRPTLSHLAARLVGANCSRKTTTSATVAIGTLTAIRTGRHEVVVSKVISGRKRSGRPLQAPAWRAAEKEAEPARLGDLFDMLAFVF